MYTQSSQMEPLFPARTSELEDLARELVAASARLEGRLSPLVLSTMQDSLRIVNSYYSNLIEGHRMRVAPLLQQLAIEGELTRGAAFQIIEMSERTGRNIAVFRWMRPGEFFTAETLSAPSQRGEKACLCVASAASASRR